MNQQLYTIEEVAELLRVDPRTIRQYIKDKKINAIKLSHRVVRIPAESINYLLKGDKNAN